MRAVPEIFRRGDDLLNLTVACPTFALPHSLSRRQDCTLAPLNSRRDRYPRPAHPDLRPDTNNRPCLNGLANCRFACVRDRQYGMGPWGVGQFFGGVVSEQTQALALLASGSQLQTLRATEVEREKDAVLPLRKSIAFILKDRFYVFKDF